MKPSPFTYHRPASRTEMLSLLQTLDNARLLAGGQSLMPMLNLRIASPDHLIDLNSVADLSDIDVADGHLRIGAMVRQRTLERSAVVGRHMPIFGEALRHIGFQQTRNRGTIGGSIAHMDPTAELPVVTLATDAMLVLESVRGQRAIAAESLSTGYLTTQIEPDEALVRIDVPVWTEHHGCAFEEVTRRGESFAIVSVAALVELNREGTVVRAAIAVGGLVGAPQRVKAGEAALIGHRPSEDALRAAAQAAVALAADSDIYAPADYKQHLAGVLSERALRRAITRAESKMHV